MAAKPAIISARDGCFIGSTLSCLAPIVWRKPDAEKSHFEVHPHVVFVQSNGRRIMIWGLTTANFTRLHVLISLVGIASGLVVLLGFLGRKWFDRWNAVFLV